MSSDDAGDRPGDTGGPDAAAEAVLDAALADVEGDPKCSVCPADADFYLYATGRVSTFACWEHVSPYAAEVNGAPGESSKPIAVPLPSFRG